MKNEELIMNNEKYNAVGASIARPSKKENTTNANAVGAGSVSAWRNSEKPNVKHVGAGLVPAQEKATQKGITLIALIITIIILLILAGVTINLALRAKWTI